MARMLTTLLAAAALPAIWANTGVVDNSDEALAAPSEFPANTTDGGAAAPGGDGVEMPEPFPDLPGAPFNTDLVNVNAVLNVMIPAFAATTSAFVSEFGGDAPLLVRTTTIWNCVMFGAPLQPHASLPERRDQCPVASWCAHC